MPRRKRKIRNWCKPCGSATGPGAMRCDGPRRLLDGGDPFHAGAGSPPAWKARIRRCRSVSDSPRRESPGGVWAGLRSIARRLTASARTKNSFLNRPCVGCSRRQGHLRAAGSVCRDDEGQRGRPRHSKKSAARRALASRFLKRRSVRQRLPPNIAITRRRHAAF